MEESKDVTPVPVEVVMREKPKPTRADFRMVSQHLAVRRRAKRRQQKLSRKRNRR